MKPPDEDDLGDRRYERSLEIHEQIESLYRRVEDYGAYFRDAAAVDPGLPKPPGTSPGARHDPIVCALAIKAATTKRSVLALCQLGDGDNALALTRVLLENACLLEWLIRGAGRRRLDAYVMFMSVQHERIARMIDRHKARFNAAGADSEIVSDHYHQAVWANTFRDHKGQKTKTHRPTWEFDGARSSGYPLSVHDLFREIAEDDISFEYDILYGALGSDIVHSGPFSLLTIQQQIGARKTFLLRPMPDPKKRTIALATSNVAMALVLDSLTEFIGLDISCELSRLKQGAQVDPVHRTDKDRGDGRTSGSGGPRST